MKRNAVIRVAFGIAFSGLSAGMLVLAFPPFDLWFLAWFAMVPALLATLEQTIPFLVA